jgi:hypothetical protein
LSVSFSNCWSNSSAFCFNESISLGAMPGLPLATVITLPLSLALTERTPQPRKSRCCQSQWKQWIRFCSRQYKKLNRQAKNPSHRTRC